MIAKINNCIHGIMPVYFRQASTISHPTRFAIHKRSMMVYRFIFFLSALFTISSAAFASADSLVYAFSFTDTTKYDSQLTNDVDLKSDPGKIQLAPGDAKNLALGSRMRAVYTGSFPMTSGSDPKPDTTKMNGDKLHDGNFFTYVEFTTPTNVASQIKIDLQVIRRVNRIEVYTLGNLTQSYRLRPQAFSYFAGLDSNRQSKIFQEFNNLDSARHTAFITDPQPVRYLTFVIDKQDAQLSTILSEFRIYGEGYVTEGFYVSKVDSAGNSKANFAFAQIAGDIPTGTSVGIEMRTGTTKIFDSTKWSNWSAPVIFETQEAALAGGKLVVAEPRKYFQYRLRLYTSNLSTPKVSSIKIVYQNTLVSDSTSAGVTPQEVPVLSPITLTYSINSVFSGTSLGVDTIVITTPSPSVVQRVSVNGTSVSYDFIPHPDKMVIAFPSTILTTSSIDIVFSTKMITGGSFPSELISKASPWNPQTVDARKTSLGDAWDIITSGVPNSPLVDVRIDPNPFTPNGDGKNDATIIDFSIANLEKPKPLRIKIFDLSGRLVRVVADMLSGVNPFFGDPRTGGKGFLWDGKDSDGKSVRPGVYIVQVSLDSDNGGKVVSKTVVVSY